MKRNWMLLIFCLALPLGVGLLSALLTGDAMSMFGAIEQPPLSPPPIVFPVAWIVLYSLMGISSYLILTSGDGEENVQKTIRIYGWQLVVNFLWPTFFFSFGWYFFALLWLLLLWVLVYRMIREFYRIFPVAAYLNIPYLVWLTFAAYLNAGVWVLNR